MPQFNYDSREFVGVVNYDDGDLTRDTRFTYYQDSDTVWGTYEGGGVVFGTLIAKPLSDGSLDMVWQYLNRDGKFISGTCVSKPEILPDGRYRLYESWETSDGVSGTSVIQEVSPKD